MPASDDLAPIWVRSFRSQGLDPDGAEWLVELWLEAKQPLAEHAIRAMQMRLDGVAVKEIQAAFGLKHHATVQRWSETALTRILAPHLSKIESWADALGKGTPVVAVAESAGVEPCLIETALHGWPPVTQVSNEQQAQATALWRDNRSLDEVAEALEWSPTRIRQLIREKHLVLEPSRVTPTDLESRLGWSRAQVKTARKQGLVPAPDSEGWSIWWWESTIAERLEPRLIEKCLICGARFETVRGRAIHESWHRP